MEESKEYRLDLRFYSGFSGLLPIILKMSQHTWFEHFKEQLQGLTEAFKESSSSLSLLGYALEQKKLRSEDYFAWARTHHGLPQLQPRFFTETPLSQAMFAKWATHYPWSMECLPVAEWDGLLIVACLEPPRDFPTNPGSILLLADLDSLASSWKKLHTNVPLKLVTAPVAALELQDDPEAALDATLFAEESEKLDGLFEEHTVTQLQSLGAVIEDMEVKAVESKAPPTKPVLPPELRAEVDEKTQVIFPPPPAPETKAALATPAIPRPETAVKPVLSAVPAGGFALDKLKKKHSSALTERIQNTFIEMKSQFQKSLILTLDDEETQVIVFAWDEDFQNISDTGVRFPLKTPSIFNIVAETQKAFHGYVSINEINEKFFIEWNHGQIPDHVTISPLIVEDKLVGMLMGFADKSSYNKTALNLVQKLSTDFTKGLNAA